MDRSANRPERSPYRHPALVERGERPPLLPRTRARWSKPGPLSLSIGGSLLVHVIALAALAKAPSPTLEDGRSDRGYDGFPKAFVLHAQLMREIDSFPPSEAVQACFDQATVDPEGAMLLDARSYGYATWDPGWISIEAAPASPSPSEREGHERWLHGDAEACFNTAMGAGWSGSGRVAIRLMRRDERTVIAQTMAIDESASDPRLLCCLREMQAAVAPFVRLGAETRYSIHLGDEGIILSRNPFPG
uniref:Uncharacterized protein n=1 Tax=Racemicystis crocea TaxID=1707966 RepID=A0A3S5GYN3_9BACT|nr:hypothetical protein [Racemicystis crocea]